MQAKNTTGTHRRKCPNIADMRRIRSGSMISPVRLAYGLIPLLTAVEKHHADIDQILDLADIPRFALVDPKYTITFEQELIVASAVIDYLPESCAGLEAAKYVDFNTFSVLGLAMQSCQNLGEMTDILFSYPRLAWGASDFESFENEDFNAYRLMSHPDQGRCEQFMKERDQASLLNLYRKASGVNIKYTEVRFAFPTPANIKLYEEFYQCPVLYNCEFTECIYPKSQSDILLPSASTLAKEFYIAQCADLSDSLSQPFEYATSVRDRLRRTVPIPDLETLANKMSMAPRTLQRRLMQENVTFSDLLRDVRLNQAKELLEGGTDTLQQIGWKLGFNDAVAFSHAFKRWTDLSPGLWRDQKK